MVRASDVVLMLVALLFPPISAAMITGCSCDLLINVVRSILHFNKRLSNVKCLTVLGVLPGTIHAFWLIYKVSCLLHLVANQADVPQKMKAEETFGEGGYTYLGNGEFQPHGHMGGPPGQGAPCKLTALVMANQLMSSRSPAPSAGSPTAILWSYQGLKVKE